MDALVARLEAATTVAGELNEAGAAKKYQELLAGHGLDLGKVEVKALAAKVQQSPVRYALVAALDHWAHIVGKEQLLAVARQVDPDPWRDQVRDAQNWLSLDRLKELAAEFKAADDEARKKKLAVARPGLRKRAQAVGDE